MLKRGANFKGSLGLACEEQAFCIRFHCVRIRAVKKNSSIYLILVNKTTRSKIQQTHRL
jgi:hypothetical protein